MHAHGSLADLLRPPGRWTPLPLLRPAPWTRASLRGPGRARIQGRLRRLMHQERRGEYQLDGVSIIEVFGTSTFRKLTLLGRRCPPQARRPLSCKLFRARKLADPRCRSDNPRSDAAAIEFASVCRTRSGPTRDRLAARVLSPDHAFGAHARVALSGRSRRARLDPKRHFTVDAVFVACEAWARDKPLRRPGATLEAAPARATTARAPGRRDARAGGGEKHERRRRSPQCTCTGAWRTSRGRLAACAWSEGAFGAYACAVLSRRGRRARLDPKPPLHGRRCLRRQRSLSMAQLVPFRARATFEAAPARNDARPRAHVARLRVLRDYSAVTGTFAARRLLPDVRPSSGGSEDSGLRYHQGLTALPEQALRQITTAAGHSSGTRQRIAGATQQSMESRRLQEGP
jgi:hypothetical protein